MARILLVGTATLDLVFSLDHFPGSDEEMRAHGLRACRGGNAANSAVVLASLGHRVDFLGVLSASAESAVITRDFDDYAVGYGHCPRLPGRPPTSSIYLTGANRSIVHYRDLPELPAYSLYTIDLSGYDCVHFEVRNIPQLQLMLRHVRHHYPRLPVSLELEKPRTGFEAVLEQADLLMCSRGIATHYAIDDPHHFLAQIGKAAARSNVVVAWGDRGAFALGANRQACDAPAVPQERVVDTLGAGDTFNAGMLHGMVVGWPLENTLSFSCKIASRKCGHHGFAFLKGGL